MKKIILFLPAFLFLFSCSSPENETIQKPFESDAARPKPDIIKADPNKLTKVIFFPGQTYEKRLYFYPNGLLKRVANRFGVTYQTYIYDSNNNLTNIISSSPSTFTYDSSNHITSYNGKPVVYDALTNKYTFFYIPSNDYDWADRTEILLSEELLLTRYTTYYTVASEPENLFYWTNGLQAGYSNNNMTYVINSTDPSGPSFTHDNKVNPLKAALLPVCRANSVGGGEFMYGEYCSSNNVIGNGSGKGPESNIFEITYNANNLPESTVIQEYYNGNLESSRLFAQYFYQTNTLP